MSRRTPAFVAVMLSVCAAGIVPHAALADAALSDPATLILSGGGPGADKPEKHLKFIAITPKGCTLRDTVFSPAGLKTDVYACHLLPGEAFPKREKNGLLKQDSVLSLSFDLPAGSQQVDFRISGGGAYPSGPAGSPLPAQLTTAGIYQVAGPLPPALDAKSTDAPRAAGAPPPPRVLHVTLDGFDCKFEIVGQGLTDCMPYNWGPSSVSIFVDGNYTRQPEYYSSVTLTAADKSWRMYGSDFAPYTPIMIAIHRGDMHAVDALLAKGADLGPDDQHHDAPLVLAIRINHLDVARELVEHGAPVKGTTMFHEPLLCAAMDNDHTNPGQTADLVKSMLAHGAEVNPPGDRLPLFCAMGQRDTKLTASLIAAGADLKAVGSIYNGKSGTAYDFAETSQQADMMALIAQHGGKRADGTVSSGPADTAQAWDAYQSGAPQPLAAPQAAPGALAAPAAPVSDPVSGSVILQWYKPSEAGAEAQDFILDKGSCTFRDTRLTGMDAQTSTYHCHLVSATQKLERGQKGEFMVNLNLPEGVRAIHFNMDGTNYVNARSLNPDVGALVLMGSFSFAQAPLPPLKVDTTDRPAMHLAIDGLDCTLAVEGLGSTHCIVANWFNGQTVEVHAAGAFLRQPTQDVRFNVVKRGDAWGLFPSRLTLFTPLMLAVQRGDAQAVNGFIAQGVDVNAHDPGAEAPVAIAIRDNHPDIATALIQHGARVTEPMQDGNTLLMEALTRTGPAAQAQGMDLVKLLLAHGADVNQASKEGGTPLMVAVMANRQDVAELFLAKGADVNMEADVFGRRLTAYDLAEFMDQLERMQGQPPQHAGMMAWLQQHGAIVLPNHGIPLGNLLKFQAGPAAGTVTLTAQAGAASGSQSVTLTDVNGGQSASAPVRKDGGFTLSLPGALPDLFSLQLSSARRHPTVVYLHGNDPVLKLAVDTPVVDGDEVTLTGSYAGPANMGILIGERTVPLKDGKFSLSSRGLKPGVNSLDVTLTTQGGLKLVQTLQITGGSRPSAAPQRQPQAPAARDTDRDDAAIKALWADYLVAFGSGNKDAVMSLMDGNAQKNQGEVFDALKDKAKDILASFSPLMRSSIDGDSAEYMVVRKDVKQGGNAFFVSFVRDPYGIWLIDSM